MADRRCTWPAWETRKNCQGYRCHDLPVCASHIRRWALANPREFAKLRIGRIRNVAARSGYGQAPDYIDVSIYQRPGPEVSRATKWRRSSAAAHGPVVVVRMRPENAMVIGDELASLGDSLSCTMIMRAVQRLDWSK